MRRSSFLKSTLFVITFLLYTNLSQAQTKLWGVGAPNGQAEGEFQNNFVQSTTASNYSVTEWTALSISDGSGANVPGAAFWERNVTGISKGAYTNNVPANSTSVANGLAVFESDFLDNGGVRGAFGTGTSPANQRAELISPRMDLTGATDSTLVVEFYSYYRHFNVTEYSVSVSVDDGVTWSAPFGIKSLQPTPQNTPVDWTVRAKFPNITTGVSNLTQCRIKFTYDGYYYFSMLDDVMVGIAPKYDIAIGFPQGNVTGSSFSEKGDIVRLSNNTHRPLANVDPNNLADWVWGAKVVNYGTQTIQASDAPKIMCSINFTDAFGMTVNDVYLDTIVGGTTDSIVNDDPFGINMIGNLRDLTFITTNGAGRYDVTYWVAHNHIDGSAVNDTIKHSFVITDDQGGASSQYLTKGKVNPLTGRTYADDRFTLNTTFVNFEYGAIYSFPRGASDTIKIDSVDFFYYLDGTFAGPNTKTIYVNVYEFVDGSNGGALNGIINQGELTKVAFSSVQLTGLGTSVPLRNYTLATATNFINPTTGGVPRYNDSSYYYIAVELNPSQVGGAIINKGNSPNLGESRINYSMNSAASGSAAPIHAITIRTVNTVGNTNFYNTVEFGNTVPAIGIHLSASKMRTTIICPRSRTNIGLRVVPNPVSDYLNVLVEFETPTNVQYIMTDVSGRVVYTNQSTDVEIGIHTIDVSNLPAGVYFVSVQTAEGISTKRVIRQ